MRKLIIITLMGSVVFGVAIAVVCPFLNVSPFPVPDRILARFIKYADDPIKSHRRELIAAKTRWEATPIKYYRMHVAAGEEKYGNRCELDVRLDHESVGRVYKDTCGEGYNIINVTELFAQAELFIPSEIIWLSNCTIWVSHSEFDPVWNIPRRIEVVQEAISPQNIGEFKYALMQSKDLPCKPYPARMPNIEVISFTPLS